MANRTIFIGDLSCFVTETHLMQLFSHCGPVASIEIKRSATGDSLMHGFVKFMQEDAAVLAVRYFHDKKYLGRRMVVNPTTSRAPKKPYNHWHKLTLHFTSRREDALDITEEVLDNLCSAFGEIGDTVVRNHAPFDASSVSMSRKTLAPITGNEIIGYAVVFFVEAAAAQRAFEALNHQTVDSVSFQCSISAHTAVSVLSAQYSEGLMNQSMSPFNMQPPTQPFHGTESAPAVPVPQRPATSFAWQLQQGPNEQQMLEAQQLQYLQKRSSPRTLATHKQTMSGNCIHSVSQYSPSLSSVSQRSLSALDANSLASTPSTNFHPSLLGSMSSSCSSSFSLPRSLDASGPVTVTSTPTAAGALALPTSLLSSMSYSRSGSSSFYVPHSHPPQGALQPLSSHASFSSGPKIPIFSSEEEAYYRQMYQYHCK